MDIALTLDRLVPNAVYQGSADSNTQEEFDSLSWLDGRTKPSWQEMLNEWVVLSSELEYSANLLVCYNNRIAAYKAKGWTCPYQLIEDLLIRGDAIISQERADIKTLYPKP